MAATYSDPSTILKDALRFLVGDVDVSQPLLLDEEYQFLIAEWIQVKNTYLLAAYAAESIAAKLTREINFTSDSQTVNASELQDKYLKLAERLRAIGKSAHPGEVYAGGMEPGVGENFGMLPLAFGTQMHDHPEAGQQDYGDYFDGTYVDDWRERWFGAS